MSISTTGASFVICFCLLALSHRALPMLGSILNMSEDTSITSPSPPAPLPSAAIIDSEAPITYEKVTMPSPTGHEPSPLPSDVYASPRTGEIHGPLNKHLDTTAPCSSDFTAFQAQAQSNSPGIVSDAKSTALMTLSEADLLDVIKGRLRSCAGFISLAKPYQRYVVQLTQPVFQATECDPDALSFGKFGARTAYAYSERLTRCASYVAALTSVQIPAPILQSEGRPTLYIIMGSGGVPVPRYPLAGKNGGATSSQGSGSQSSSPSSSGATGSGGAGGTGGSQTPGAAPSGLGIDSTTALLLYTIAITLQRTIQSDDSDPSKASFLPRDTLVIPASLWTMEDFDAECAADPYQPFAHRGTYGAIFLDGSTTNSPNQFALIVSAGWTRARYSATLATCDPYDETEPIPSARWNSKVEGYNRRVGIPLLPLAGYFAYRVPQWTQNVQNPSTTNTTQTTTGVAGTGTASKQVSVSTTRGGTNSALATYAGLAGLGTFLEGTSGFIIGDTSGAMTVPRAYADLSATLVNRLQASYCDSWVQREDRETNACVLVAQQIAPDRVLEDLRDIYLTHQAYNNVDEQHVTLDKDSLTLGFLPLSSSGKKSEPSKIICVIHKFPNIVDFFIGPSCKTKKQSDGTTTTPDGNLARFDAWKLLADPVVSARYIYCFSETANALLSEDGRCKSFGKLGSFYNDYRSRSHQVWIPNPQIAATPGPIRMSSISNSKGLGLTVASCNLTISGDSQGTFSAIIKNLGKKTILAMRLSILGVDEFNLPSGSDQSTTVSITRISVKPGSRLALPSGSFSTEIESLSWHRWSQTKHISCEPIATRDEDGHISVATLKKPK